MKKNELKKVTKTEALKNIDKLKKDLFNFRFQKIKSFKLWRTQNNDTSSNRITSCRQYWS